MDQCFRAAVWMLFAISYLQAVPTPTTTPSCSPVEMVNFRFGAIRQNVKCGTATFTYSTNVEKTCRHAVVQKFIDEMERVKTQCNTIDIDNTLEALENLELCVKSNTECQLETKTSQFEAFVDDTEHFVKTFMSDPQK